MKSMVVAIGSWPLTELYWNITARYEFPFLVTVVAFLTWLVTVKAKRKDGELFEEQIADLNAKAESLRSGSTMVQLEVGRVDQELEAMLAKIVAKVRLRVNEVVSRTDVPWVERARVLARDIAKRAGVVSVNDIHAAIQRRDLEQPRDQQAFSAIFAKGFVATGKLVKSVTPIGREKGRKVKVWRLAESRSDHN